MNYTQEEWILKARDKVGGDADEPHVESEPTPSPKPNRKTELRRRFPVTWFEDTVFSTAPPSLVQGMLPRSGIAVVWGPPKCGKSFWIFDLLMHVALGWEYRERRVESGPVVYISLEGNTAFPRRIEAFKQQYNIRKAPFCLITEPLSLTADVVALINDLKTQIGDTPPIAVCIDTLNQSLVGSESKDSDMAAYLKAGVHISRVFDCLVIVVHHCGYDDTHARGHSAIYGNTDVIIAVSRDVANNVISKVEFMKDGEDGSEVASHLKTVTIGKDDNGDPLTSCVIEPVEGAVSAAKRPKLSDQAELALRALTEVLIEAGTVPPASNNIPPNTRTCTLEKWRSGCMSRVLLTDSPSPDTQNKAFVRASNKLQVTGYIGKWNDQVWVTGQAGQAQTR